jgi:hypothetical protein
MTMQAPTGLRKIAYNMHQDVFIVHDSYADVLDFSVHNLSSEEMAETKAFLTELLVEPVDLRKVRETWSPLQTDIRIDDDKDLSEFLKTVRDRLVG